MVGYCKCCNTRHPVASRIAGKLGGAAVGGLLGRIFGLPAGTFLGGVVGSALGHLADQELSRRCPDCGEALEVILDAMV